MIELLAEGTESLRLPCSWLLVLPALGAALGGRRRAVLVTAVFVLVASTVAWLRFSGFWPLGDLANATQAVVGLAMLLAVGLASRTDSPLSHAGLAAVSGIAGAWAWIPCVGPHLGDVINGAGVEPFNHIGGTLAFVTGLLVPFIILAAADYVSPTLADKTSQDGVVKAGLVLTALVGILFGVTLFDDLAGELARLSNF